MEPMTLGSPSGSPATNPSPYLPAFLMGETQVPTTPRNTLSPNKGSRNVSFAASPVHYSPTQQQQQQAEQNRFSMSQRSIFNSSVGANYSGTQGPPTQGLFDSLRNERTQMETPTRAMDSQGPLVGLNFGTPVTNQNVNGNVFGAANQSFQQQQLQQSQVMGGQYDTSLLSNNTSYNASRCMGSPLGAIGTPNASGIGVNNASYMLQCPPTPRYTDFWITVYGFPPSAISTILQHFAQCGTIIDKAFPPQNGNWVHLKYASRLECDKALNYNEKILGNNIMIGVTQCKERSIIDKENLCENNIQPCKVRPLAQAAYKCAQNESSVVSNADAPQKSSGFMNKAMDLFFGW